MGTLCVSNISIGDSNLMSNYFLSLSLSVASMSGHQTNCTNKYVRVYALNLCVYCVHTWYFHLETIHRD